MGVYGKTVMQEGFVSLGVLIFNLFYLINALKIPLGTFNDPGPGFFPTLLGFLGVITSIIIAVNAFLQARDGQISRQNMSDENIPKEGIWRLYGYLIALASLAAFFETVGSLFGIFILGFVLAKISGLRGWWKPLLLSVSLSLAIYAVFALWLKVPLPNNLF